MRMSATCSCYSQAAVADPDPSCPVVPLLGYLQAPPSDEAFEMTQDPADTVWLVRIPARHTPACVLSCGREACQPKQCSCMAGRGCAPDLLLTMLGAQSPWQTACPPAVAPMTASTPPTVYGMLCDQVYKFEGMRPMSLMLQQMDLPEEPAGITALFKSK